MRPANVIPFNTVFASGPLSLSVPEIMSFRYVEAPQGRFMQGPTQIIFLAFLLTAGRILWWARQLINL